MDSPNQQVGNQMLLEKKSPTYKLQLWGLQSTTCAFTTANYETSTFDNVLQDSKCTPSTSKSDENWIWVVVFDATFLSTPPILSTNKVAKTF